MRDQGKTEQGTRKVAQLIWYLGQTNIPVKIKRIYGKYGHQSTNKYLRGPLY